MGHLVDRFNDNVRNNNPNTCNQSNPLLSFLTRACAKQVYAAADTLGQQTARY